MIKKLSKPKIQRLQYYFQFLKFIAQTLQSNVKIHKTYFLYQKEDLENISIEEKQETLNSQKKSQNGQYLINEYNLQKRVTRSKENLNKSQGNSVEDKLILQKSNQKNQNQYPTQQKVSEQNSLIKNGKSIIAKSQDQSAQQVSGLKQKSCQSKQKCKFDDKQQKKQNENQLNTDEDNINKSELINSNQKKKKGNINTVQQNTKQNQNEEVVEKIQKRRKLNSILNSNQQKNQNSNQQKNGNNYDNKIQNNENEVDNLNQDKENTIPQITENTKNQSNEQNKNQQDVSFRSDTPDYLLILIDDIIQFDQYFVLRKKFSTQYIDEIMESSTFINQQENKYSKVQIYLPFQQDKVYPYKEVIIGSKLQQQSKNLKKKKGTNSRSKKLSNNKNTLKDSLNIATPQKIEQQVFDKPNDQISIQKGENQISQDKSENQEYINMEEDIMNNEDNTMNAEEDNQVDIENFEESDDNNSDVDIFEDYINEFSSQEDIYQIKNSKLPAKYKKLFLEDLNYQVQVKNFNYSKIYKTDTIPELQLNSLTQTKITNIDAIRARAEGNTYYEFSELDKDMRKLFNYTLRFRCKSVQSFQYITQLIKNYYEHIKEKDSISQIEEIKKKDLKTLFKGDQENKMQVKKWPIIPTSYRNYIQITEYDSQPPSFDKEIKEKLKSEKVPIKCDKKCVCNSFQKMGEFNLESSTWTSKCLNRANRMECIQCECKNQQISKNQRQVNQNSINQFQNIFIILQVVGADVEETLCWGIDLYTKKNIFYVLPERFSDDEKNMFIQFQLMKSINLQKDKGWDILQCCNFILERSQSKMQRILKTGELQEPKFNEDCRKCAKSIIKAIKYIKKTFLDLQIDPEGLYSEAFRIHTKGMGLICINPKGIEQNQFITEYIGEIYQPWRWFEKQDIIKKYMKEFNKRDILPDFWNIMLEIHKDDPKGYDILFVDPILKGNFCSRLSHSCEPNCGTVTSITNQGNYVIAMFAMNQIDYGEELSFDYMAVTESVQEHKRAVCLCGSSKCREKYLELSNSNIKQFNSILEKIHCFLNRTFILYRACTEELNTEDEELLEKNSFRTNIRNNSPKWLQKWSALILRIIDQEQEIFLQELIDIEKKKIPKESLTGMTTDQINQKIDLPYLKYQAQSRKDARIQNLVISIDKVKYYIIQIKEQSPPLLEIQNDVNQIKFKSLQYLIKQKNQKQLLENYWIKSESTLKDDLLEMLQSIHYKAVNYQLVEYAQVIIQNATKQIQVFYKFGQFDHGMLVVRIVVLLISDFLLQMKNCNIQSDALSLILHFHAFTHKFFKAQSYKKYTSEDQKIQKEDVINVELFDEDQKGNIQEFTPFSDKKIYSSLCVWGQLNMWYKQSVANPGSSLSLERRGTLIYPQLSSFKEVTNQFPFSDSKQAVLF